MFIELIGYTIPHLFPLVKFILMNIKLNKQKPYLDVHGRKRRGQAPALQDRFCRNLCDYGQKHPYVEKDPASSARGSSTV